MPENEYPMTPAVQVLAPLGVPDTGTFGTNLNGQLDPGGQPSGGHADMPLVVADYVLPPKRGTRMIHNRHGFLPRFTVMRDDLNSTAV
jgi:hypothetical protein